MLICTGCGEVIRESQLKRISEPHGEIFPICPACGDTPIEAAQCRCGDWHDPEDLFPGGYCEVCLCDDISIDLAEAYISDLDEWETFYTDFWLNGRKYWMELLSKFFHSKPENEQCEKLRDYIFATKYGPANFAAWLQERGEASGA